MRFDYGQHSMVAEDIVSVVVEEIIISTGYGTRSGWDPKLMVNMRDGTRVCVYSASMDADYQLKKGRDYFIKHWREALGPVCGDLHKPTIQFSYSDPLNFNTTI